jgi:hypothetical protein
MLESLMLGSMVLESLMLESMVLESLVRQSLMLENLSPRLRLRLRRPRRLSP